MSVPVMAVTVYEGMAVPNTTAASPSLTDGNNNFANTPGATGLLVPPQSPSGAVTTNTGRTTTATQAFLSKFVIS